MKKIELTLIILITLILVLFMFVFYQTNNKITKNVVLNNENNNILTKLWNKKINKINCYTYLSNKLNEQAQCIVSKKEINNMDAINKKISLKKFPENIIFFEFINGKLNIKTKNSNSLKSLNNSNINNDIQDVLKKIENEEKLK